MLRYLLVLFIGLPLLDMILLFYVAQYIGILETALLVVFTGIVGASMIKQEGRDVLSRLQNSTFLAEAGTTLIEGALLVAGGVFLLSPGIITDILGFGLIFSFTRQRLAVRLRDRFDGMENVSFEFHRF